MLQKFDERNRDLLVNINGKSAAEFWKEVEGKKP